MKRDNAQVCAHHPAAAGGAGHYAAERACPGAGTRDEVPVTGDERTILAAVLDWHQQTFELKGSGVPRSGCPRRTSRRPG
jgi:hypothetical protein